MGHPTPQPRYRAGVGGGGGQEGPVKEGVWRTVDVNRSWSRVSRLLTLCYREGVDRPRGVGWRGSPWKSPRTLLPGTYTLRSEGRCVPCARVVV